MIATQSTKVYELLKRYFKSDAELKSVFKKVEKTLTYNYYEIELLRKKRIGKLVKFVSISIFIFAYTSLFIYKSLQ